MVTNPSTDAVNLINIAHQRAANAAHTIATLSVVNDEVGSSEFSSGNLINPLLSLKKAEIETSAAVKILQTENKMIGSLFDAIS